MSISALTSGATALSGLIAVSPQATIGYSPQQPAGATPSLLSSVAKALLPSQSPVILFHYEGEQTAKLSSDITDHFIEDNSAIQDQISLKPIVISTHGFIGEVNDVPPNAVLAALQVAAQKLVALGEYTPALSITAQLAYNQASQLYQVGQNLANSAIAAFSSITGTGGESVIGNNGLVIQPNQTKQQLCFQQFYGYWSSRTLFTVQTPWAVFQNMAIQELTAIQDETTNTVTDFNVTFKQINIANALSVLDAQGRLQTQSAGTVNLGIGGVASTNTSVGSVLP